MSPADRRLPQRTAGDSDSLPARSCARVALSVLSLSTCFFMAGFFAGGQSGGYRRGGGGGPEISSSSGRTAGRWGNSQTLLDSPAQRAAHRSMDPAFTLQRRSVAAKEPLSGSSQAGAGSLSHGPADAQHVAASDAHRRKLKRRAAAPLPDLTSLPLGTRVTVVTPDRKHSRLARSPVRLLHVAGARAYSPDVSLNLITMRSFFETVMAEEGPRSGAVNLTISFHMTNPEAAALANEMARRFVEAFVESTPGYFELGLLVSSGASNAYVTEVQACDRDPGCRYMIYLEDDHFMQAENLLGYTLKDYIHFFDSNPGANYLKWNSRPNIPIRQMPSCLECDKATMSKAGIQADMPLCMTEHFAERIHMIRASFMAKAVRIGAVPANITHNLQATWPCAAAMPKDGGEKADPSSAEHSRRVSRRLMDSYIPEKQCRWEQWWMKCGYFMLGDYNHPQTSTHVDGKHFPGLDRFWVDYNWIPQAAKMLGPRAPPTEENFDDTYERNGHVRLFPPQSEDERIVSK